MKKNILLAVFTLVVSVGVVFAQSRSMAVMPFDVVGNAVTADEIEAITELYTSALIETGRVSVVDRTNFDKIFKEKFAENNLVLEENTAYRLVDHFPCTNIIRKHKSGFFEITKTAIATEKTKNNFDTNKIIFDEKKVEIY